MAADVLGLLDEMTACPELVACLSSSGPQVRLAAARALGRLGMPQAADALIRCLVPAEEPEVRAAAAWALGRVLDPRAVAALAACLADPHYWVAHNAAQAMAQLGPPGRQALTAAVSAGGPGVPHAREALSRPLRTGRPLLPGGIAP